MIPRGDKQFLETPFYGVRQMTWHLRNEDHLVNEKRIRRLMRLMGLMPIYQKPNTSKAAKGHKICRAGCALVGPIRSGVPPLGTLLCNALPDSGHHLPADGAWVPVFGGDPLPGRVMRSMIPRGVDWHTRKVLAWRISNTLEADFCVEALNEAIHRFGPPEIMNTDQGSQFTSFVWTDRLKRVGTGISMDGKGRFLDNIFVERLCRSLKYECVYLHAWETGSEAKAGIRKWIEF